MHLFSSNSVITSSYSLYNWALYRGETGQRVQGSVGTYDLEQVTPLQRSHHHSVCNGSLAAAGREVRRTHDGGAGKGGHSHPEEVDASGHSVAGIRNPPFSKDTGRVNLKEDRDCCKWQSSLWTTRPTRVRKTVRVCRLSSLWLSLLPRPHYQRAATCSHPHPPSPPPKMLNEALLVPSRMEATCPAVGLRWHRSHPKFSSAHRWAWPQGFWVLSYPFSGDLAIPHCLEQQQTSITVKQLLFLGSPMPQGPLGSNKLCADRGQSLHSLLINLFKNQATVSRVESPSLEDSHEMAPVPPRATFVSPTHPHKALPVPEQPSRGDSPTCRGTASGI